MTNKRRTSPIQKAIALQYNPLSVAPELIAKGKGSIADGIIKKATESNIPIVTDEKLVEELDNVLIGDFIPPELYEAVAQILIFIDRLDNEENYVEHEMR